MPEVPALLTEGAEVVRVMEDVIPVEELIIKEELDDDIKVRGAAEVDGSVRVDERQRQKQPLVAETGGGGQEVEAEERAIRGKEEPVMYACTLCVKQYRTCTALRSHLSRLHRVASAPGLRCRLCGAVGQSKATLRRHMRRSHSLAPTRQEELLRKCSECGEGVPSLSSLYSHLRSSHSDVLHHYHHCHLCPALVRSRPSLIRHCSRAHPGAKVPALTNQECPECGVGCRSVTALRRHLRTTHPSVLLHKCQHCKAAFKYSYLLNRHTKVVHLGKETTVHRHNYKCDDCGRLYLRKARLASHIMKVHSYPSQQRYHCTSCNLDFPNNKDKMRHYRTVHRVRAHQCHECSKCFDTAQELKEHRQEHRVRCTVCNKTFLRRDSLREHLLIHDGPRLPCPFCPKTFVQNSNLKRHIRTHTGEKPYQCTFCSKRFGDKSACNSHIRVHTGAERCRCHLCGTSFSKRQKLNYHMRKHTGDGLLYCPLCTRPSTDSYSLKKHVESHRQALVEVLLGLGLACPDECRRVAVEALHDLAAVVAGRQGPRKPWQPNQVERGHPVNDTAVVCKIEDLDSDFEVEIDRPSNSLDYFEKFENGDGRPLKSNNDFEKFENGDGQFSKSNNVNDFEKFRDSWPSKSNFCNQIGKFPDLRGSGKPYGLRSAGRTRSSHDGSDDALGSSAEVSSKLLDGVKTQFAGMNMPSSDFQWKRLNHVTGNRAASGDLHQFQHKAGLKGRMDMADDELRVSPSTGVTPAAVLTRLIEDIVDTHCRAAEIDVKPTLADQLVEQCLQVIMSDNPPADDPAIRRLSADQGMEASGGHPGATIANNMETNGMLPFNSEVNSSDVDPTDASGTTDRCHPATKRVSHMWRRCRPLPLPPSTTNS